MNFKQLGDYAKVQGGYAYKSKDFSDTGIPVLKIKNVGKGNLIYSEVSYVNESFIDTTSSFVTKEGDVLISMTGSNINQPDSMVGRVARVSKDDPISLINQRVGRIIITDEEAVDLRFLYYILSQYEVQYYLVSNATGSANQVNINGKLIESIKVPDYNLNTQKKIAHILSTLDDKIELNRKMNQTLEEMAQALFKSWFVDFDPVHLKAGCKSDAELERGARELGISKEVLELFPSEFEESELGMIPEGWEVKKVSELVSKSNTGADAIQKAPIVDYDTGIRCARVGDFSNNRSLPSWGFSKVDEKNYKNYKLMKNDILITRTSLIGLSKIIREDIPAVYNNGLIRIKPIISSEFLYINFQSNIFKTYISRITGESSTRPNMKINYFLDYKLIMPDEKILTIIHDTLFTLLEELDCNIKQIDTLQKTRDTLLPKLLSGELDVSNINARAEYEL